MPWPFAKSRRVDKAQLLKSAQEQAQRGIPRQTLCNQFLELSKKPSSADQQRAYLEAEAALFEVMVERNLTGKELERAGAIDRAVALYEANLADGFIGSHPYERLRIIYAKRQDHPNALRVCRAYLALARGDAQKKSRFREHAEKLAGKIGPGTQ